MDINETHCINHFDICVCVYVYIYVSNRYVVHLELIQCSMSVTSITRKIIWRIEWVIHEKETISVHWGLMLQNPLPCFGWSHMHLTPVAMEGGAQVHVNLDPRSTLSCSSPLFSLEPPRTSPGTCEPHIRVGFTTFLQWLRLRYSSQHSLAVGLRG